MLKHVLAQILNDEEISILSSAFDVVGDIAIVKIPHGLTSKENLIAEKILSQMKNVRTILKQNSSVKGEYRTRDLVFLGGEKKYVSIYKENGCLFKVDLRTVYFSPRLSTERARIESMVKDEERILNMFAGIGTFSIIIAKKKNCIVDSVDSNPAAIEFALESLKLNKKLKGKVVPILGDAMAYARAHLGSFDRVLLPLPEKAHEFLLSAFESCKLDGESSVHYYVHVSQEQFLDKNWISWHLEKLDLKRKYEVVNWKRVREVGPRYIQAVADIKIL